MVNLLTTQPPLSRNWPSLNRLFHGGAVKDRALRDLYRATPSFWNGTSVSSVSHENFRVNPEDLIYPYIPTELGNIMFIRRTILAKTIK